MMSDEAELQEFAERLVRLVRDRSIVACDRLATGESRGVLGERWHDVLVSDVARHALTALIPDIVDQVLFELLNAVDNGDLPLGWRGADHSFVALEEIGYGEMSGWLMMGAGGWLERLSTQRFFDPHANLHLREDSTDSNDA